MVSEYILNFVKCINIMLFTSNVLITILFGIGISLNIKCIYIIDTHLFYYMPQMIINDLNYYCKVE